MSRAMFSKGCPAFEEVWKEQPHPTKKFWVDSSLERATPTEERHSHPTFFSCKLSNYKQK